MGNSLAIGAVLPQGDGLGAQTAQAIDLGCWLRWKVMSHKTGFSRSAGTADFVNNPGAKIGQQAVQVMSGTMVASQRAVQTGPTHGLALSERASLRFENQRSMCVGTLMDPCWGPCGGESALKTLVRAEATSMCSTGKNPVSRPHLNIRLSPLVSDSVPASRVRPPWVYSVSPQDKREVKNPH